MGSGYVSSLRVRLRVMGTCRSGRYVGAYPIVSTSFLCCYLVTVGHFMTCRNAIVGRVGARTSEFGVGLINGGLRPVAVPRESAPVLNVYFC